MVDEFDLDDILDFDKHLFTYLILVQFYNPKSVCDFFRINSKGYIGQVHPGLSHKTGHRRGKIH